MIEEQNLQTNSVDTSETEESESQDSAEARRLIEVVNKNKELEEKVKSLEKAKKEFYDATLNNSLNLPVVEEKPLPDGFNESDKSTFATMGNLKFIKKTLEEIDKAKALKKPSPLLPKTDNIEDSEYALYGYDGKVERLFRDCLEKCEDDNDVVTYLEKHIPDFKKTVNYK